MTGLTAELVARVARITPAALDEAARANACALILDTIGVIVAGHEEPLGVGRIACDYARMMGGAPQAGVLGASLRLPMTQAAFVNGTLGHALDFDSTLFPLIHPSSPSVPAILAAAEYVGASGADVVAAYVAAVEVQARMRLAARGWSAGQGFHKPGIVGLIGATVGAGRILGLDERQMVMALGQAGSRAGAIAINTGTMTKSSHSGHAARMGVECAVLAQMGWTATGDVFGKGGVLDCFVGADTDPQALTRDFAAPFYLVSPGVGIKKYPCNYFTHRVIDGVLALRAGHDFAPGDVQGIGIEFPDFDYVIRPRPDSGLDAKFSIQYTAAVAVLDGAVGLQSFSQARWSAPDVQAMLGRVRVDKNPDIPADFTRMHCVITLDLADGRQLRQQVRELSGWADSPLSADQRHAKFRNCLANRPDLDADRIIAGTEALFDCADIRDLMEKLNRDC